MTAGAEKQNGMVLEDLMFVGEEEQPLTLCGLTAPLVSLGRRIKGIQYPKDQECF